MPVLKFFWRMLLAVYGQDDVYNVVSFNHPSADAAREDLLANLEEDTKGCRVIAFEITSYYD